MSLASLRSVLEIRQVAIYFAAVVLAGLVAWQWPASTAMAPAIDPLLGFMLFVTFLQVPLTELRRAWSNMRFLGALLLAAQMLLLPVYLGLFMGDAAAGLVQWEPFLHAFVWLIAVPLSLATICQAWAARSTAGERTVEWLGLLPVPATAAVLFVVVASVAPQLGLALDAVRQVAPIYVAFAVAAPMLGWGAARLCRLPSDQGRAVAFSAATRNSLVVLPLGLAIPGALPWVPAVIVTQTLVELVSELVYVKVAPRLGERVVPAA